ncbi:DUF6894 family protein [Agrobacterium vitis]|uniref:DUF6894 family protein n=1 Tax=Agrobacterium vitis TaxID=373 RepID=UPI000872EA64|nr:hypothetical protein [Agrobacterium vitis]MCE6076808.1 hypothetical protein [Agrobacterium vitis]MCM2450111.1 hypothetical protein [Agrobacterium vitis]MCM2470858.1 hypothetical protein [Agrobacterium vitis]MUO71192.1 hypothetical protein [Agrobacterium vitis]MUO84344.1 hypothetical protein [Agrobacterium vitis]
MSARYFFNIVTAAGTISDLEGAELSSLEEAREEAFWDARALMSVAILDGRDISSRSIEICNEDQERLLLVAFREAISVTE